MKRLLLLLLATALIFVITGCPLTQLTDTQSYAFKKIARSAGIFIALEKPDDVQEALAYCEHISSLKTGALKEAALKTAMKYIKNKYGSSFKAVILMGEAVDLIKYVWPDETGLDFDTKLLDIAVDSFKEGLEITSN